MKRIHEKLNIYKADEGCLIISKSNGRMVGNILRLDALDSIDNYEEVAISDYVEPGPTASELLEAAKKEKIAEIERYNKSDAVNCFYLGEQQMWLTRDDRTQIDESIAAYENTGESTMTKYFGGKPYTFPLTVWRQMLSMLIVYASEALNVTEMHKAAVNALESVEDVEAFDITAGYPEKLVFPATV